MFLIALIRSTLRRILRFGKPCEAVLNIMPKPFSVYFFFLPHIFMRKRKDIVSGRVSAGPGEGGNPGGDQGQVQGAHQALASGQGQPIIP
jgi:hypothetical protein